MVINYSRSESDARATLQACEDAGAQAILVRADVSGSTTLTGGPARANENRDTRTE